MTLFIPIKKVQVDAATAVAVDGFVRAPRVIHDVKSLHYISNAARDMQ